MIKLVTFDWNGTLLADTRACMDADNHVLKTFGGNPVDLKTYRDTIIIPAIDFYTLHGCDREELEAKYEEVGRTFHEFYEPRASRCRTRIGTRKALEFLKRQSIDSIILSNHTLGGIGFQLRRLKISDYISHVLANSELDSSMKERNKQKRLSQFLGSRDYESDEVIIIGDSPEEVEIGKALGLRTVAITDGYYSTPRLEASGPDHLITNIKELIGVVKL
jgi:phosphoglycolate phosphatase-like HAD superfamily hydrolase